MNKQQVCMMGFALLFGFAALRAMASAAAPDSGHSETYAPLSSIFSPGQH